MRAYTRAIKTRAFNDISIFFDGEQGRKGLATSFFLFCISRRAMHSFLSSRLILLSPFFPVAVFRRSPTPFLGEPSLREINYASVYLSLSLPRTTFTAPPSRRLAQDSSRSYYECCDDEWVGSGHSRDTARRLLGAKVLGNKCALRIRKLRIVSPALRLNR